MLICLALIGYDTKSMLMEKCLHNAFLVGTFPGGGCEILFSPGLSVCLCVCLSVRPIFWHFISRLLEEILKFIQDTNRVVLNSLKKKDLHTSKVKVTGKVLCFMKVQSYHKN